MRSSLLVASCLVSAPLAAQGPVELVDRSSSGQAADGSSYAPAISADGNVVAFISGSDNLAPGLAPDGGYAVYVRDRIAGTCEIAEIAFDGTAGDQGSFKPSISADGRYVAFVSIATNLVVNDTNGSASDLFVRDRVRGTTTIASLTSQGAQAATAEGMLSADARFVVFDSDSEAVVPGDTNHVTDVFVRDLVNGTVERVSRRADGSEAQQPSRSGKISADGARVAFASFDALVAADNDVFEDVYVLDRASGVLHLASPTFDGSPSANESMRPVLAAGGAVVAFLSNDARLVPDDSNGATDAFWFDIALGTVGRASVRHGGAQIPFSQVDQPAISGDGRFIGFESRGDVVPGVTAGLREYVHDRLTRATLLVDMAPGGAEGDASSDSAVALSFHGEWVAWDSHSTNLLPNDPPHSDVFVRALVPALPYTYCEAKPNSLGVAAHVSSSGTPSVSSGAPFLVETRGAIGGQAGMLVYGFSPRNVPWLGGSSCVAEPFERTRMQLASGGGSGAFRFDFNARIRGGFDPRLVSGTVVYAQYWYRDPLDPTGFGVGLSDALAFTIEP